MTIQEFYEKLTSTADMSPLLEALRQLTLNENPTALRDAELDNEWIIWQEAALHNEWAYWNEAGTEA